MIQKKTKRWYGILLIITMIGMLIFYDGEEQQEELTTEETNTTNTQAQTEKLSDEELKERFGKHCITEQIYEVEISEYDGKVYFVPYKPRDYLDLKIFQGEKVLNEFNTFVPDALENEKFVSLDDVGFEDVNFDDCTDIIMLMTYGDSSVVNIHYGFPKGANEHEARFDMEITLSENVQTQLREFTVSEICQFLTEGKKNGEFESYQEAYMSRSRLTEIEYGAGNREYNLIYVDDDDIPELVAGTNGYHTSLYTYKDGRLYTLMDAWPYGTMGNIGYYYSPKKNSVRHYGYENENELEGPIDYISYDAISEKNTLDTIALIEKHYPNDVIESDDVNEVQKYMEEHAKTYISGREVTQEECDSYDVGNYEFIEVEMDIDGLYEMLKSE